MSQTRIKAKDSAKKNVQNQADEAATLMPQTQTKAKFVKLEEVKNVGELTKYKAWIDYYRVRGLTAGGREAVEKVVSRMAEAKADLPDKLRRMVAVAANNTVAAVESGAVDDVGIVVGTSFYLGEYLGVAVKLQRITHPRTNTRWWGVIRVVFKGFDGHKSLSKHLVERYVEFYSDKVPHDKLYNVLYETARLAFNAYSRTSP